MKLVLCISGNLGFIIFQHLKNSELDIICIFTDKGSEQIIQQANQEQIPVYIGNPRKGNSRKFSSAYQADLLLSVNYLYLIDEELIRWPKRFAINIHGSLLPKYRGRTPHVWAIINNELQTGITAHLIDEGCDTGPIIDQLVIPIEENDTGGKILEKFGVQYPFFVDRVLHAVAQNNIKFYPQDKTRATYFGKRTPADGAINWNWQKERIRNWVRAQAHPYPGAFTWAGKEKLIIDQIAFDDLGFHYETPNGTVLALDPLRVKTPNGAIRIEIARQIPDSLFVNQCLGGHENS